MGLIAIAVRTIMITSTGTSNLVIASVKVNDKNPNTDEPSEAGQEAADLSSVLYLANLIHQLLDISFFPLRLSALVE